MNNRNLAIAFGVLLLLYLALKWGRGARERTFDPQVLRVDTSLVHSVTVSTPEDGPFAMKRMGGDWVIVRDGQSYKAAPYSVRGLLGSLKEVRADRIVAKSADRAAQYGVDPAGGTRVELSGPSGQLADVIVGRFHFDQAAGGGISYIRLTDKDDVYAVTGFLSISLTGGFDHYRDKTLVELPGGQVRTLALQMGGGAERRLTSMGTSWQTSDGEPIDSVGMATYINNLQTVLGGNFVQSSADIGDMLAKLTIDADNLTEPVVVACFASNSGEQPFILQSSQNRDAYFYSDSAGVYQRLIGSFP